MDPLDYPIGQLAARSVRHQFEYEAKGKVSPTQTARTVRAARGFKRLPSLAKHLATSHGAVPATERR